jgi:hypothetical protein
MPASSAFRAKISTAESTSTISSGGLGFDFDGFAGGGLFDRLFRRHVGPTRGVNIEVTLHVLLERAVEGGEETVKI